MEALLAKFFTEDEGKYRGNGFEFLRDIMQVACEEFSATLKDFHKPDPSKTLVSQDQELKLRVFCGELNTPNLNPKMTKAFVELACNTLMEEIKKCGLTTNDKITSTYFTFDFCRTLATDSAVCPEWGHLHPNTAVMGPPSLLRGEPEGDVGLHNFTCPGMWVIAILKLKTVQPVFTLADA